MYELEFLQGAEGVQKIADLLTRHAACHDLWHASQKSPVELTAIGNVRCVGFNHHGQVTGLVDVFARQVCAEAVKDENHGAILSRSCFVLTPDLSVVEDFGVIPGYNICEPHRLAMV